jgi:hypothetical protein
MSDCQFQGSSGVFANSGAIHLRYAGDRWSGLIDPLLIVEEVMT